MTNERSAQAPMLDRALGYISEMTLCAWSPGSAARFRDITGIDADVC